MASNRAGTVRLDGEAVLEARRRAGLSREKLAELSRGELALSVATLKRAEKGRAVHLGTARALAELLAVPLESVLRSAPSAAREVSSPPPSPRPPLIRRRAELGRLLEAFGHTRAGRPRAVIVSGEVGIGKTRLLRELCLPVTNEGAVWYMGQGHERGGFALQPVLEALSPHATRLLAQAGDEDRTPLLALLDPAAASDGGDDDAAERRHRAFTALFRVFARAPRSEPTVLVLDDLQWLDRGSLDLFEHLLFAAAQAAWRGQDCPLLLLGATRHVEADSPLAQVLARFEREELFERVDLSGLDEAGTFELLESLGLERPSPSVAHAFHQATGGNPFFLQEAVRYLRSAEASEDGAALITSTLNVLDLKLPESMTAAVRHRLKALDDRCRLALIHAACLGAHFEISLLALVMGVEEDELIDPLEDAIDEGLLEDDGPDLVFAHALIRHAAYQLASEARRQRIHHAIAERLLARHRSDLGVHVRDVAMHLLLAGPFADPREVVVRASQAAERASASFAWEDAARFHAAAANAATATKTFDEGDRAKLHHKAAVAFHRNWDVAAALEHYDRAIEIWRTTGDTLGAATALNDRVRLTHNRGMRPDPEELEEVLERLPREEAALRGAILGTLADCYMARDLERASELAAEAFSVARESDNPGLCAQVAGARAQALAAGGDLRGALAAWDEGIECAQHAGDRINESRALQRMPLVLFALGELERAEEVSLRGWTLTADLPNLGESSLLLAARACVALIQGRLTDAIACGQESVSLVRQSGYAVAVPYVYPPLVCALAVSGRDAEASAVIDGLVEGATDPRFVERTAARCRGLLAGETSTAPSGELGPRPRASIGQMANLAGYVELAGHAGAAISGCHALLVEALEAGVVLTNGWPLFLPRIAAVAAALEEKPGAREAFDEALVVADRLGAPVERARVLLDRAAHGVDPARRDEDLAEARAIARRLGLAAIERRAVGHARE